MARMYTCDDIDTVKDLLCAMAHKATERDYVVLTQMVNTCIMGKLIWDSPYIMDMVAKFPEYTTRGVVICMASHYFDDREGIVLSKDRSYIGGWMDSDHIGIMLMAISLWIEYMDRKYLGVE